MSIVPFFKGNLECNTKARWEMFLNGQIVRPSVSDTKLRFCFENHNAAINICIIKYALVPRTAP